MKFKVGDRVKTDYGNGVIKDTDEETNEYQVYIGNSVMCWLEEKELYQIEQTKEK